MSTPSKIIVYVEKPSGFISESFQVQPETTIEEIVGQMRTRMNSFTKAHPTLNLPSNFGSFELFESKRGSNDRKISPFENPSKIVEGWRRRSADPLAHPKFLFKEPMNSIRVFFVDYTYTEVQLTERATIGELKTAVLSKVRIKLEQASGFSIYEVKESTGSERKLKESEKLFPVMGTWSTFKTDTSDGLNASNRLVPEKTKDKFVCINEAEPTRSVTSSSKIGTTSPTSSSGSIPTSPISGGSQAKANKILGVSLPTVSASGEKQDAKLAKKFGIKPEIIRIFFVDDTFRSFSILPSTTIRELLDMIAHKLNLKSTSDFGIFVTLKKGGRSRLLGEEEFPIRVRTEWESKQAAANASTSTETGLRFLFAERESGGRVRSRSRSRGLSRSRGGGRAAAIKQSVPTADGISKLQTEAALEKKPWKQNMVLQGWLIKQGGAIKTWKRRWVIIGNNYLYYFVDKDAEWPKGVINLLGTSIEPKVDAQTGKKNSFGIRTPKRVYYMAAEQEKDYQGWIRTLEGSTKVSKAAQLAASIRASSEAAVRKATGGKDSNPTSPSRIRDAMATYLPSNHPSLSAEEIQDMVAPVNMSKPVYAPEVSLTDVTSLTDSTGVSDSTTTPGPATPKQTAKAVAPPPTAQGQGKGKEGSKEKHEQDEQDDQDDLSGMPDISSPLPPIVEDPNFSYDPSTGEVLNLQPLTAIDIADFTSDSGLTNKSNNSSSTLGSWIRKVSPFRSARKTPAPPVSAKAGERQADKYFDTSQAKAAGERRQKLSEAIQRRAFTNWANIYLRDRSMYINKLETDISDGVLLINLVEIISGKNFVKYHKSPRLLAQALDNFTVAFGSLRRQGVELPLACSAEDIVDGNITVILRLLWSLISFYELQNFETNPSQTKLKELLMLWLYANLSSEFKKKYPKAVTNFTESFKDGIIFYGLLQCHLPDQFPLENLPNDRGSVIKETALSWMELAFNAALKNFGIPILFAPQDIAAEYADELSIMTYLLMCRRAFPAPAEKARTAEAIVEVIKDTMDATGTDMVGSSDEEGEESGSGNPGSGKKRQRSRSVASGIASGGSHPSPSKVAALQSVPTPAVPDDNAENEPSKGTTSTASFAALVAGSAQKMEGLGGTADAPKIPDPVPAPDPPPSSSSSSRSTASAKAPPPAAVPATASAPPSTSTKQVEGEAPKSKRAPPPLPPKPVKKLPPVPDQPPPSSADADKELEDLLQALIDEDRRKEYEAQHVILPGPQDPQPRTKAGLSAEKKAKLGKIWKNPRLSANLNSWKSPLEKREFRKIMALDAENDADFGWAKGEDDFEAEGEGEDDIDGQTGSNTTTADVISFYAATDDTNPNPTT